MLAIHNIPHRRIQLSVYVYLYMQKARSLLQMGSDDSLQHLFHVALPGGQRGGCNQRTLSIVDAAPGGASKVAI